MPFVSIKVAGPELAPEQVRRLEQEASRLMADVMGKVPELIAVLVEQAPAAAWTVGARQVRAAAHLDVKVTAGSNTPEEKRQFIAEAMAMFRSVLGSELDPVAYVVVHEVSGDAWGWNGQTQTDRAQAAKSARRRSERSPDRQPAPLRRRRLRPAHSAARPLVVVEPRR